MEDVRLEPTKEMSLDKFFIYLNAEYKGMILRTGRESLTYIRGGFDSTWDSLESLVKHLRGN